MRNLSEVDETIFYEHTNQNLKVYIYDMMVKTHDEGKHCDGVRPTLASVRRNNMRMNKKMLFWRTSWKTFWVQAD